MRMMKFALLVGSKLYPNPQGGPPTRLSSLGILLPLVGTVPPDRGLTLDEMRARCALADTLEEAARAAATQAPAPEWLWLPAEQYALLQELLANARWGVVDGFILQVVDAVNAAEEVKLGAVDHPAEAAA